MLDYSETNLLPLECIRVRHLLQSSGEHQTKLLLLLSWGTWKVPVTLMLRIIVSLWLVLATCNCRCSLRVACRYMNRVSGVDKCGFKRCCVRSGCSFDR